MQTKEENHISRLFAKAAIWGLLLYAVGFAVWTIFFTETGNGDNVEHIHSAWLVAYGKIPYRDFFQHHNPLLWYLFAPLIKFFSNPLVLLDAAHAVAIVAGGLTFFIVYKICTSFFASRYASLLSLLLLCPPYYYIYCFNFNPDTFMALFFAMGLYFLFSYWKNPRLYALVIAFAAFFVAVMFTQKILTVLLPLGIISLGILWKMRVPPADIAYALLLPIVGTVAFIAWLYSESILYRYWQTNYIFNAGMQAYYGEKRIDVIDWQVFILAASLAIISIICFWRKGNTCFKVLSVLFVLELVQRCFYFSIAPYYMLPFMIFAVCLNSVLIEKLTQKYSIAVWVMLLVAVVYAGISETRYLSARTTDRSFARYLANNVTPCDYVISSFLGNQSIMSKDPHYYWALLGHIDVAGEAMNIALKPNLNRLVELYKPKLINSGVYWNNYYLNRGISVPVQQISPELIKKYYLPTPFQDIYILKYEYHGKNCHYDTEKREWLYEN